MQTGLKWVALSILVPFLATGAAIVRAEEPLPAAEAPAADVPVDPVLAEAQPAPVAAPAAPVAEAALPDASPPAEAAQAAPPVAPAPEVVAESPTVPAPPTPEPTAVADAPAEAAAPADAARPFDVLLVLDNSASMKRNDPQGLMRAVVQQFAQRLPSDARFGVVLFEDKTDLALGLTDAGSADFATQVDVAATRLSYRGQRTNIPAGVERALYELRTHGRADAHRVIVLLTDGIVDLGSEARSVDQARWLRENLAAEAREHGVRMFGIAFTEQADTQLIQAVAQITGGAYFRVLAPSEIGGVFDQVRSRIDDLVRAAAAEAEAARVAATPKIVEKPVPVLVDNPVIVEKPVVVETKERTRVVKQKPIIIREPVVTPVPVPEPMVDWRIVLIAVSGLTVLGIVALVALRSGRRGGGVDAAMPTARLKVVTEGQKPRVYKLKKPVTRIGRAKDNDIVLPFETVSAHHAIIEWRDGAFHVKDLGSTNGTSNNGMCFSDREHREPRAVRLRHHDRIGLDKHTFEFQMAGAERVNETQIGSLGTASATVVRLESVKGGSKAEAGAPDPALAESPADASETRVKGQKCLIHERWDATRLCPECGRAWCDWCLTEKDGKAMCRGCAEKAA